MRSLRIGGTRVGKRNRHGHDSLDIGYESAG
jgi:hypothetical protein